MTNIPPEVIEEVCKETHLPAIQAAFGRPGIDAAFRVMEAAKSLYKHVEPERVSGRVVIFQTISSEMVSGDAPPSGPVADFASLANQSITDLVLEIASDGQPYRLIQPIDALDELAKTAVVYHWSGGQEEFLAGTFRKTVLRLDKAARSQFAVPTFPTLRAALQNYASEHVRESTCYIFQGVWFDNGRLFLKAKPEETMRNSLLQFLRNRIGGEHDIWPEQNVDESHPVDIRVKPRLSNNRLMLIEIKWLGISTAPDGHVTSTHGNSRAQQGADQLVGYLDKQRQFAPTDVVHGYYVIIDGRRRNLHEGAATIPRSDGFHFETEELTFNPSHHDTREDFDPPYRMFARPDSRGLTEHG